MKKYVVIMLLLPAFALLLSACGQSEEEKIQEYLDANSRNFYEFSVVDFTDGNLNMELKMLPNFETMSNDEAEFDVRFETKQALEAIDNYSKEHSVVVEEVDLSFVTRETNRTVGEIRVNKDTLSETKWSEVSNQALPPTLDEYKFYVE